MKYNDYLLSNSPRYSIYYILFVIIIFLKLNSSQTHSHKYIQSFHERKWKHNIKKLNDTDTYSHNEQGQSSIKCLNFHFRTISNMNLFLKMKLQREKWEL